MKLKFCVGWKDGKLNNRLKLSRYIIKKKERNKCVIVLDIINH